MYHQPRYPTPTTKPKVKKDVKIIIKGRRRVPKLPFDFDKCVANESEVVANG